MCYMKIICIFLLPCILCGCVSTNKSETNAQYMREIKPTIADNQGVEPVNDDITIPIMETDLYPKQEIEEVKFSRDKPWEYEGYSEHTKICVPDEIAAKEIASIFIGIQPENFDGYKAETVEFFETEKVWVVAFCKEEESVNSALKVAIKQEDAQILNMWIAGSDSAYSLDTEPWKNPDCPLPIPVIPDKETVAAITEAIIRAYMRDDVYFPPIVAKKAWYDAEEGYWLIYTHEAVVSLSSNTLTFTVDEKDGRIVKKWVYA